MLKYGKIVEAIVSDENNDYYYVQYEGITFELDKNNVDESLKLGDVVEGIIYEDKNRKRVFQTQLPDIRPGYYGWGNVVASRKDLGVFVDIGLHNKDIVVSLDVLPDNRNQWPKKGDKLFLSYVVDDKNRFWGQLAHEEDFKDQFIFAPKRLMNQEVEARIHTLKLVGAQAITQEGFSAFIHESEWVTPPRLGELIKARVIDVRGNGSSINLSTKPRAHEVIDEDALMIQTILERKPNHFLALHDKSSPDQIRTELGISKGQFKRAIGSLLKNDIITQKIGEGIYLNISKE